MSDLVAFLRARLVAERAVAERIAARLVYPPDRELAGQSYWPMPTVRRAAERSDEDAATLIGAFSPARVLAEVDAKRRIIAEHPLIEASEPKVHPFPYGCETCHFDREEGVYGDGPCTTLKLLALPYADHPDYRQEWRP